MRTSFTASIIEFSNQDKRHVFSHLLLSMPMAAQRLGIFARRRSRGTKAARNERGLSKTAGNLHWVSQGMTNAPFVRGFFTGFPC